MSDDKKPGGGGAGAAKPAGAGGGGGGGGGGAAPPPKKPSLFAKNSPLWLGISAMVVLMFTAIVLFLHKKMPKPSKEPDKAAHTIWSAGYMQEYLRNRQTEKKAAPQSNPVLEEIPASVRPRFEFYSMLPELNVELPRQARPPAPPPQRLPPPQPMAPAASYAPAPQPVQQVQRAPVVVETAQRRVAPAPVQAAPAPQGRNILLQAGSFSRQNDANTQRGKIILQGLRAQVQAVNVNGQTRYRVIVGPLDNSAYNRASDKLNRAGIAHFITR